MSATDVMLARDQLATAVLRWLTAERRLNSSDPSAHAADDLEYAEEMVDEAAVALVEAKAVQWAEARKFA